MPLSFSGHSADALPDWNPDALSVWPLAALSEDVGSSLELRTRELMLRLHRHHPESATHSIRVAGITMAMWRVAPDLLGDGGTALLGSLLHDIGKLCVPREILTSRGVLDAEEMAVMTAHAAKGAELLQALGFPESIASVAGGHHERWSGGGYPTGLTARLQAPLVRAVAVADAFDAMTDPDRTYRAPLGLEDALREVAACSGTHFEPRAAEVLAVTLSARTRQSPLPPPRRLSPDRNPADLDVIH